MREEQRTGSERRQPRRSEQGRLRTIVERMADGIVIVDLDGRIRFANPSAEKLFGRPARDLIGTEFGLAALSSETTEIDVVRPGGETVVVELRSVEMDWEGSPAFLISLRDVTDRRRAEERAMQLDRERIARAEAEAASQAKSEFLAVMSHELRTPLNAVIGYAELLDLGIAGPMNAEQRHQLTRIRASGRHLLGLVNEVLDLAKVEAGRLSLQISAARASEAADAALAIVEPAAESRGVRLSGVCEGDPDSVYQGDEDRVRQILVNLLNNAVKFTEAGGSVVLECGVSKRPDPEARLSGGPFVWFRVVDTGIGIPTDQLSTIFDPFVQVERGHTRQSEGSGLGLTISRRLARLMGGDLTVRSELGKGSTFTLWVPLVTNATRAAAERKVEAREAAVRLHGIAEIGEALVRELDPIVATFVNRLRAEATLPRVQSLGFAQLADHVGAYIADIGGVLIAVEESGGQPSTLIADGTEIQRVVAERHGAQRARLGWTADALRLEWKILREELERSIRKRLRPLRETVLTEALVIVERFMEQAEELSCRALTRARNAVAESAEESSTAGAARGP